MDWSPWGHKQSDTTERGAYVRLNITLNYTVLNIMDHSQMVLSSQDTWVKCGCSGCGGRRAVGETDNETRDQDEAEGGSGMK